MFSASHRPGVLDLFGSDQAGEVALEWRGPRKILARPMRTAARCADTEAGIRVAMSEEYLV